MLFYCKNILKPISSTNQATIPIKANFIKYRVNVKLMTKSKHQNGRFTFKTKY